MLEATFDLVTVAVENAAKSRKAARWSVTRIKRGVDGEIVRCHHDDFMLDIAIRGEALSIYYESPTFKSWPIYNQITKSLSLSDPHWQRKLAAIVLIAWRIGKLAVLKNKFRSR